MKLSLWTILKHLEQANLSPVPLITDGTPRIEGCRLRPIGHSTNTIADILPASEVETDSTFRTVLVSGEDRIFFPNADIPRVHDEVSGILDYYNDWEKRLLVCLSHNGSLQELLDIAHDLFRRPMFIKGDSSWVFAITRGYDESVHPGWAEFEESLATQKANFEAVRAVSLDPEFRTVFSRRYPSLIKSPNYGGMVLHANIWLEEHRVCEIVALENGIPFRRSDSHLMHVFSRMVETHVLNNRSRYFATSALSAFFIELLEGGKFSAADLMSLNQTAVWQAHDELAVMCAEATPGGETPILGVLRDKFNDSLRHSCVFLFRNRVICVLNLTKLGGYSAVIRQITKIISSEPFTWGISYEFVGAERVPEFYQQALLACSLAFKSGKSSMDMYQAAHMRISERLRSISDLQALVHPDLRRLERVDMGGSTHYLETLYAFLICGGNYTDTAAYLGLHRNSLIYRMTKIQDIISSNLSDTQNKRLLLISYLLMGVNF